MHISIKFTPLTVENVWAEVSIILQVVVWLYYKREELGDIWRGGCKSCHNNNGNFTHICLDNPFLPYNDETSNDYTLPKKSWVGNIRWFQPTKNHYHFYSWNEQQTKPHQILESEGLTF